MTNHGELFDMKDAPFDEIAVPSDTRSADAIAARKRLQAVLDQHPAAPGRAAPRALKKQQKKKKKKAARRA